MLTYLQMLFIYLALILHIVYWEVHFCIVYLFQHSRSSSDAQAALACHFYINKEETRACCVYRQHREKRRGREAGNILKTQLRSFQGELFPECQMCGETKHESI